MIKLVVAIGPTEVRNCAYLGTRITIGSVP